MKIIKRNGTEVPFDITKIIVAVSKANQSVDEKLRLSREQITQIAAAVTDRCQQLNRAVSVEEVQDMVENQLMDVQAHDVARHYITYRYVQNLKRQTNTTDERILSLIECNNEEVKQENSNKNPTVNSVQRDYMAGEISKDLTARLLLPPDIVKAHREGLIHFHDADYFAQHMHNCDLVNLEDMLQNGTVISGTFIEKPHSFSTACNIATQIIAQVASNQYGGQSISLTHLAPFVDVSRKKIAAEVESEMEGLPVTEERKKAIVEKRLRAEINRGVQTIQYQVVTLMTTNGQAPFITVFMYLGEARNPQEKADLAIIIEETIRQRYQGVKNEAGVWITPAFPKLIYVLEEDNIRPGSPYYYLTELAAKCTAKRMVPDYISEKKMLELKVDKNGEGHCYTCMGCRSFLTPYVDPETNQPKYYGRFNQGVVTINLVDVALSSGGNFEEFWKIFDERLDLCHRALQCRHKRLLGTLSDAAPILWQYGALARLKKGEKIDKLLFGGYSTISLGYAGLYECVKYMTGKSHTDAEAKPFALSVMQHMNDCCKAWKQAENIDYSLYGTPLESTTYKFATCLQKRFGIIPGITDKNYITNSYHVHVSEQIDAFTKLKFESEFQELSPGGAISYVEVPNMQDNLEAVMSVLQFIYDNIMYAELNTKSDYCQCCGYDGEIQIVEDDGKLVWECPRVRQPRPAQAPRRPPHLRVYRDPVLEPGPYPGDPGPGASPVRNAKTPAGLIRRGLFIGSCVYIRRGSSGHAGADAGAQGAGVLRDHLDGAAVIQPQQAQQALCIGDLTVGVVDAHVAVQAAGRVDDLVDLVDVADSNSLDHKGTFLSVRVCGCACLQAEAPARHAGVLQGGLRRGPAAERIQNHCNIFHSNFSFSKKPQAPCTPFIARCNAPALRRRIQPNRALIPGFPHRDLADALYPASLPVLYSSCTSNSIIFCEQSQISASHTSFTSPGQLFSFRLYGKMSPSHAHIFFSIYQ